MIKVLSPLSTKVMSTGSVISATKRAFTCVPHWALLPYPGPLQNSQPTTVRAGVLAPIVTYTLGQAARAEGTVPTQFVIGYDDEVSTSSFIANVVDLIHPRYFPLLASASQTKPARPQENDAEVRDLL